MAAVRMSGLLRLLTRQPRSPPPEHAAGAEKTRDKGSVPVVRAVKHTSETWWRLPSGSLHQVPPLKILTARRN